MSRIRRSEERVYKEMIALGGKHRGLHISKAKAKDISGDTYHLLRKLDIRGETLCKAVTELRANGLLKRVGKGHWQVVEKEYMVIGVREDVTPEKVQKMRDKGMSWDSIGRALKINGHRAKAMVDAEYAKHYKEYNKRRNAQRRMLYDSDRETVFRPKIIRPTLVDTRDLTGILMGDPIPDRWKMLQKEET